MSILRSRWLLPPCAPGLIGAVVMWAALARSGHAAPASTTPTPADVLPPGPFEETCCPAWGPPSVRSALESLLRRGISLRRPVGTFEADDEAGDEDEADGDLQLDLSDAEER